MQQLHLGMLGCGEGKYNIHYRTLSKENRFLMLKRPKPTIGFLGSIFKGNIWVMVAVCGLASIGWW